MTRNRVWTAIGVALAVLAGAVVVGLIGGRLAPMPERVAASGDTFALSAAPGARSGGADYLAAGGYDGGAAISYVKFDVTIPDHQTLGSAKPARVWLWLGRHSGDLPELVELTQVLDTGWDEYTLNADTAPRLGTVVSSVVPRPHSPAIAFDVTSVITASGRYAFAVTAPTSTKLAKFVAREALGAVHGQPTVTFEWERVTASPQASAATAPPTAPAVAQSGSTPSASAPSVSPWPDTPISPSATVAVPSAPATAVSPSVSPSAPVLGPVECSVGPLLLPTCGALWGVAAGAHTRKDRVRAFHDFERIAGRPQAIYHAYHRGDQIFPTEAEIRLTEDPDHSRILFLNWKPQAATWGEISRGHPHIDAYLDRLAQHIRSSFPDNLFYFTMHHEPENEVIARLGSDMTARDYAAAFSYVIKRLRANGVSNLVSVMCYMAYMPWNVAPWFEQLYPGDDVVDWVAWDIYAYSDPGYGHGDFAEMMNRRSGNRPGWPGFYNWAAQTFPSKPLMVAEWGVWHSGRNPGHQAAFFRSARLQLELFPRVKAYVYFESPNAEGRDSRVDRTEVGMSAFQQFSLHPAFDLAIRRALAVG